MRTCFMCAAIAALFVPAGARAQSMVLTEAEALSQLGSGSARVQAARALVDVARADILAAGRWPNPRFTFNREAVAGIAEDMLTVSQVLPVTGRRRLEIGAATARADAASHRADDRIRRVRADLRLAFTDLWAAQEQEREFGRARDRVEELARILGAREAAGDSAGFERLRAERELLDLDTSRALSAAERAQAQAILAGFITVPRDAPIEAVMPSAPGATLPTVDELMARAETTRGDLMALTRELDSAGLAELAAGRRAIPEPELVAGTKTSNLAGGGAGSILSVHVPIPLFDRAQPERAAAQGRGRQARAEADVLRQTIRAQIAAWRTTVVARRGVADRHRAALAAGTADIERIARVSYEAGERGILELLDAYRSGSSARIRQAELDAAVRQAEIELEFISGWEMP